MDRCLICHRKLKDKESQERGMGPICWRRVKKVVEADKEKRMARRTNSRRMSGEIKGQITFFNETSNKEDK